MIDPVVAERAEAELDGFIERRTRERRKDNELEDMWRESERKHHEKQRRENRAARPCFHPFGVARQGWP